VTNKRETPLSAAQFEARKTPRSLRIIVADDDRDTVLTLMIVLRHEGHEALGAYTGRQVLSVLERFEADAIVLDIAMPELSGWETMAALASRPETKGIPILILSVLSEAEGEPPTAPVLDWLQKPISEPALFAALERAVGGQPQPFKVLVVEDDRDVSELLTSIFEAHGFETFNAISGRDAIQISQRVVPDLLVLDVGLPEADGFEVVDWLRRHERLHTLPIVVYTGRELSDADRERLRLAEIAEFFTKGRISPEDFERRVMALIGRLTGHRPKQREDEHEAHPVG
jgi:CheY-like chemotaxis protein